MSGDAGLTETELAQAAGLRSASLWRLEDGRAQPKWATVRSLADALGISCERFREVAGPCPNKQVADVGNDFGLRLHELREQAGLSPIDLAGLPGVTAELLARWEQGSSEPRWSEALAVAVALGVSAAAFQVTPVRKRAGSARKGKQP